MIRRPARSRARPHLYVADLAVPSAQPDGAHPCTCGLPYEHPSHTLPPLPDGPDAQRRAAGERGPDAS